MEITHYGNNGKLEYGIQPNAIAYLHFLKRIVNNFFFQLKPDIKEHIGTTQVCISLLIKKIIRKKLKKM